MSYYSIKNLENLSGIKANTLRIWEKRYKLLSPKRSDTNIRYYEDRDLRMLLNISTLLQNGWKVSKASQLDQSAIVEEVIKLQEELPEKASDFSPFINSLLIATLELNPTSFEELFSRAITKYGLKETMLQIINPLLRKIGLMWAVWNLEPGQEHFASNLIRQKLCSAIENITVANHGSKKFLLFLPEGEFHEIGLLFTHYLFRSEGFMVSSLGQNTPFEAVVQVAEKQKPDYLLTFLIMDSHGTILQKYIEQLADVFSDKGIYIAGSHQIREKLNLPKSINWLYSPHDFELFLKV